MTPGAATLTWVEANQRHLVAALGRVRSALQRHAERLTPADGRSRADPSAAESLAAPTTG